MSPASIVCVWSSWFAPGSVFVEEERGAGLLQVDWTIYMCKTQPANQKSQPSLAELKGVW